MTPREQLDHCLVRFLTAAFTGDDTAARSAFTDAQALPELVRVRQEAKLWAAQERALWGLLADDQLDGTPACTPAALTRARRRTTA